MFTVGKEVEEGEEKGEIFSVGFIDIIIIIRDGIERMKQTALRRRREKVDRSVVWRTMTARKI